MGLLDVRKALGWPCLHEAGCLDSVWAVGCVHACPSTIIHLHTLKKNFLSRNHDSCLMQVLHYICFTPKYVLLCMYCVP